MIVPENEIRRELEPGEAILWTGQPDPGKSARQMVWFSLACVGWMVILFFLFKTFNGQLSATIGQGPVYFLFGLSAISTIVQVFCVPIWLAKRFRATAYAITNKRILVVVSGANRTVRAFPDIDVDALKVEERPDGSGNLIFAKPSDLEGNLPSILRNTQFNAIPAVRDVERLIRNTFSRGVRR